MFRIKICGVRRLADVTAAADAGADAVGLNFFPSSARYVSPHDAATRAVALAAARRGLRRIAVVVNMEAAEIDELLSRVPLDAIQLHGDETVADVQSLRQFNIPLIRAIRLAPGPLASEAIEAAVRPWRAAGCAILLDADAGAARGGIGQRLDWNSLAAWAATYSAGESWLLAGGLTPLNVQQAIRQAVPSGVDVSSGVERLRGEKCPQLIHAFCAAASQGGV